MTYKELKEYALQYKNAMLEAGYIYKDTVSDGYYECTEKGNDKTVAIAGKHWRGAIRAESNDEPDDIIEVWAPWSLDNPTGGWTWCTLSKDPHSIPYLEETITFLVNAYELNTSVPSVDYVELDDIVL
jgi:hypothetical protein